MKALIFLIKLRPRMKTICNKKSVFVYKDKH
jgi:hypothetical protein